MAKLAKRVSVKGAEATSAAPNVAKGGTKKPLPPPKLKPLGGEGHVPVQGPPGFGNTKAR